MDRTKCAHPAELSIFYHQFFPIQEFTANLKRIKFLRHKMQYLIAVWQNQ